MSTAGLTPAQWAKQRKAERLAAAAAEQEQRDRLNAEPLLRDNGLQVFPPGETPPYRVEDTCCGQCTGGTCYVDQVTGA